MRKEIIGFPLLHEHVQSPIFHGGHPLVQHFKLVQQRLIHGHTAPDDLHFFRQCIMVVIQCAFIEKFMNFLQGQIIIPQGKGFQQRNRLSKRIVAIPIVLCICVDQLHFFIMLQQVGCNTHLLRVIPNAIVLDFLFFHSFSAF